MFGSYLIGCCNVDATVLSAVELSSAKFHFGVLKFVEQ